MPALARTAATLADLVLPGSCVGCRQPGPGLCRECRAALEPVEVEVGDVRVCAAGAYDGALRQAVLSYKERGRRDLAAALGDLLAVATARAAAG